MGGGNSQIWGLLLILLPCCHGFASFSSADEDAMRNVCETLVADHSSAAPNQTVQAPFSITLHVGTWLYSPGTTKKITVSLRHTVSSSGNDQLTLKGFIVQARKAVIGSSTEGVGSWISGAEEAVLECDGGSSTAIVQANGTVGRTLPITLIYRAPETNVGPIKFLASWVQDLTTYMEIPTDTAILIAGEPCADTPCKRGGTCAPDSTDSRGHTCECPLGITGDNCDEYVCSPDPCGLNKICQLDIYDEDPDRLYLCKCSQNGYSGDSCEIAPCDADPCQNNGICLELNMAVDGQYYICQCPPQYDGHDCEKPGPCLANPCNGGICIQNTNNSDDYTCDCSPTANIGANCEIDACLMDETLGGCKNGGACILREASPACVCPPGYLTVDCSLHLCDLNPGPCSPIFKQCVRTTSATGYSCDCTVLFTNRPNCTTRTDVPLTCLAGNPCQNGGTCHAYPNYDSLHPLPFDCACTSEFEGDICDTAGICSAERDPCQNGGTCQVFSDPDSSHPLPFDCGCTLEFKGETCDITKTRCEIYDPECVNGGSCNNDDTVPICTCPTGFNNTYCQDDVMPPVIACQDLVVPGNGRHQYFINYINDFGIEVSDNSGAFNTSWTPSLSFPVEVKIGKNKFSVFAVDPTGNRAWCEFNVILTDTIAPNVTCPSLVIVTAMPGLKTAQVLLPEILSRDNYGNVSLTSNFNDTEPAALGGYDVMVTAVDDAGNRKNCSFTIIVEEPQLLYVAFAVDENFSENYTNSSHPDFQQFEARLLSSMLAEVDVTDFADAYAGVMINSLSSGSVEVNSVVMINSLLNVSDPGTLQQFVDALNSSILDDGLLGNMSIIEGSLMVSIDICMLTPCLNGGVCMGGTVNNVTCDCENTGYEGPLCEEKIDYCLASVCENGGTCVNELLSSRCDCTVDYTGDACEIQVDHCADLPCENNGTCTSGVGGIYTCACTDDYEGNNCENRVDHCLTTPCQNGGTCELGARSTYTCSCTVDWTGGDCEMAVDHCADEPCLNNGVCSSLPGGTFSCACTVGYVGDTCETEVNFCADNPCENSGVCTSMPTGFSCECTADFTGGRCQEIVDHCATSPCRNSGVCSLIDGGGFTCGCTVDYTGKTCEEAVDHCAGNPCLNSGVCTSLINGAFTCDCAGTGFIGDTCEMEGLYSGVCTSLINGAFTCDCAGTGFIGDTCEMEVDPCSSNPCLNSGNCSSDASGYTCACTVDFEGTMCQTPVDHCDPNPCNDGVCLVVSNSFSCFCTVGFIGDTCDVDLCDPSPCENNGTCQRDVKDYTCTCSYPYTGKDCNVTDYCSAKPCLNGGQCSNDVDGYSCNCTGTGYGGTECQIDLTPCDQTPCSNNGTCLNLAQGDYNCTCDEVKWSGTHCEIDLTPCDSSPCLNNGTCQNLAGGEFNCTCDEVDWTGPLCEIDLQPCSPNPCDNDGACTEHEEFGNFSCGCNETEWTGPLCDVDMTPCDPMPCLNGGNCTELGPGNYSCECAWVYDGQECEIDLLPCLSSPCLNEGTCRNGTDPGTFVCDCAGDWVGVNCMSISTVCNNNPCENGATCVPSENGPTCECTANFAGQMCTVAIDTVDECASSPCLNGGTCINLIDNYACNCKVAFAGFNCQTNENEAGAVVTDSNSSWWIIALCICFLIIIGIAAACVCVSMSKKASN